jgi:hypothetical protein
MTSNQETIFVCSRLQHLGFACGHRAKLYGEEFEFTSDPILEEQGYCIEGLARRSGDSRRVPIPLPVVRTIEHEIWVTEQERAA